MVLEVSLTMATGIVLDCDDVNIPVVFVAVVTVVASATTSPILTMPLPV